MALNPLTPIQLLAEFVHDWSADVRWAVVSTHPHEPDLERLFVEDPDDMVHDHARRHVNHPATRTFQDDGRLQFSYAHVEDADSDEVVFPDDPIGEEMISQYTEPKAKRRSLAT